MRKAIALDGGRVELVAPSIKMAVTNRLPDLPGFKKAPAEMTAMIDAVDWEAVAKHIIVTG